MERVADKYKKKLMKLGKKIKERRSHKRWSQQDLADKTGYSKSLISKLETGNRMPSLRVVYDIAEAFNIKMSTLFRD